VLCCMYVCMYICMYKYRTVRAGRGKVQYKQYIRVREGTAAQHRGRRWHRAGYPALGIRGGREYELARVGWGLSVNISLCLSASAS
jgi:hypothetical protein